MLLLPGQRLPWKFSSSFASAVTAPMVTQTPSHGRWCIFPPLGASWSGLKCGRQGLGGSREGRGSTWLDLHLPRSGQLPAGVEIWGPLRAACLRNGRTRLDGSWYPRRICVELVAWLERQLPGEAIKDSSDKALPGRCGTLGQRGVSRGQ